MEEPAIGLFDQLGWISKSCFYEDFGQSGTLSRETPSEVVLVSRLRPALERLNAILPSRAIELAIEKLTKDRSSLSPVNANREIYKLLKDGVPVKVKDEHGAETPERVRLVDWDNPENNAQSGEHLKDLLREDHRYLFTLIHKFHNRDEQGWVSTKPYPVLSTRDDIIVMTDEAHRTQYDVLALNRRNACQTLRSSGLQERPSLPKRKRPVRSSAITSVSTTSSSPQMTMPRSRCTTRTGFLNSSSPMRI